MAKSGKKDETGRTLGASAYAAMAAVEGLVLSADGRKRVMEGSLSNADRREAIKKAYTTSKVVRGK
ncbi:MAG TPA: hypothetical protein PLK37_09145 [Terricaulis sp.]|nr:hypothetical protein [Terricaulis sp.]